MQLSIQRIIIAALAAAVASVLLAAMIGAPDRSEAALLERGDGANVVIGKDVFRATMVRNGFHWTAPNGSLDVGIQVPDPLRAGLDRGFGAQP